MKGTLFCICIARARKLPDIDFSMKIFGVRINKFSPEGWIHSNLLAPSKELLFEAKAMEKKLEWNTDVFRTFYEPSFRYEIMKSEAAKNELVNIKRELDKGNNVAFACYCGDFNKCHRKIIGEIFEKTGHKVEYN